MTKAKSKSAISEKTNRKNRTGVEARITPEDRVGLYAVQRRLSLSIKKALGLQLPFVTYLQDPLFAKANPDIAFDEEAFVNWEPGLAHGPTSARFAVVDFNADTGKLTPPAEWSEAQQSFIFAGNILDKGKADTLQFHQVNVWTLLQRALAYFEEGNGLGRSIPWAFEGNRLIIVPHAGYGENAFYDRTSKSLQFYYFGSEGAPVYTCLSADIVNHEFAHAVLDGIRPYYSESTSVQTAAFHEFIGDVTAILLTLRNNMFRNHLAAATGGQIEKANALSSIAEQFGREATGRPYLRTALNKDTMPSLEHETSPHRLSQVLTGAMFDLLMQLAKHYQTERKGHDADEASPAKASPAKAFWSAADRMQRMVIQPLDLLPPVEVTFRDYAYAVCRAEQLSNPLDPEGYYDMLIDVFLSRGILTEVDKQELKKPQYLYDRLQLSVRHDINEFSSSRAAAYRFLDDNREDLLIPANRDFFVADLYDAKKRGRQNARMPRQIILEYVWREDVALQGTEFGRFNGQTTTMLCGGTLVFDDNGIVLSWAYKPGSVPYQGKRKSAKARWDEAAKKGAERLKTLLHNLAAQIAGGRVGSIIGTEKGLIGSHMPPFIAEGQDGNVQFRLSPHLHLSEEHHLTGDSARSCELSC